MRNSLLTLTLGAMIGLGGPALAQDREQPPWTGTVKEADDYQQIEPEAGNGHDTISKGTMLMVQRELADRGYPPGGIDGIFGPRTEAALRDFQKNNDLLETGTPTPETLVELGIEVGRLRQEDLREPLPQRDFDDPPYLDDEPMGTYRTEDAYAPR